MLIGEKVTLGPVLAGDGPALFNWFNHLGLSATSGSFRPLDEARFSQWMAGLCSDPTKVIFTLRAKPDLRLIGYLQITNINPAVACAEVGLAIGDPADRGRGLGLEALTLGVRYCWDELNLRRVALFVLSNNPQALALYRKAGFEIEGVMRRAAYTDGEFRDVTIMAKLRPDGPVGGPLNS